MDEGLVSIIIPTYQSEAGIEKCLYSIRNQSYTPIEIIVVDGGSTDRTLDICDEFADTLIAGSYGMAEARLRGAEEASGEFLLHIDSDMELKDTVVEEAINASNTKDLGVIIPEMNVSESYWGKCTNIGKKLVGAANEGNLRFLPQEIYWEIGGHNVDLLGKEDEYLHVELTNCGYFTKQIDAHICHHIGDVGYFDIMKSRWEYMTSLDEIDENNPVHDGDPNTYSWKDLILVSKESPLHSIGFVILEISTVLLNLYRRLMNNG